MLQYTLRYIARKAFLRVALVSLTVPAWSSIFIGDTVTFDASVRILGPNVVGTATVFASGINANNPDLLTLCIATADHVLRNNVPQGIGIGSQPGIPRGADVPPNDSPGFSVAPLWTVISLGGPTGKEDLGFLAVTVDLSALTLAQANRLKAINPVPFGIGGFNTFTANGYGNSGRAATAAELATFGVPPLAVPAGSFDHHIPAPADEQYGIERRWTNQISVFDTNFTSSSGYMYDAAEFFFTGGRGFGLSGDSGSGMIVGGSVDYILTEAVSHPLKIVAGKTVDCNPNSDPACNSEFIEPNDLGLGVALGTNEINWFSTQNKSPEPATIILFSGGLLIFRLLRRRLNA
jgi:hypothetical protein